MTLVVCGARGVLWRTVRRCPTERVRRRMVVRDEPWYGATFHCCGCGDRWDEGGRLPRPAVRGWRRRAAADHKTMWSDASTREQAMIWLKQEIGV